MANIDDIHPLIALGATERQRIRDVVAGSQAVKKGRTTYLPASRFGQTPQEYKRLLAHTSFFPATARTAQGKRGLMFAKNVVLNCPALEPIKDVITKEGASVRDFAEEVVWEALQDNFTLLLVDHPDQPEGVDLNAANALELNYRPFIHTYPCDSILWIDYKIIRNTRKPVRVVLRESHDRILELLLIEGRYVQRVWNKVNGSWVMSETRQPTRDRVPLDEIPVVIVSDNSKPYPQSSVLQDVCELNLDHYIIASRVANIQMFGSGVVPVIAGLKLQQDNEGKTIAPELYMGPGGIIVLEDPTAKWGFLEPEGNTLGDLMTDLQNKSEMMAKVGARLLAPERVAPEAEATVAMRSAAEDSTNASLTLTYARRISQALSWCSWWIDGSKAEFTLNTDYKNRGMTAQDRVVAAAEVQQGLRSWEDWFYERRDAGLINSSLTPEEERERIDQDMADRPPLIV